MVMAPFIEHYSDQISGTLSCFDRIVIRGTLPGFSYSEGMTRYLNVNHIRIFDYPMFTNPLRTDLRDNAEQIAKENSLKIEYIKKKNFRKESRIKKILETRGNQPGLVPLVIG
jgi:hypothetical protein